MNWKANVITIIIEPWSEQVVNMGNEIKKKKSNGMFQVLFEYSEYSTIQGIIYIFQSRQSLVGRIVWVSIVAFMLLLGSYWSIQSYIDWQNNPVLTTVQTTAYPVKEIEFPAVTICGQGMSDDVISAAMFKQFFKYLETQNISIGVQPLQAQNLIYIQVQLQGDPNTGHLKSVFMCVWYFEGI